MSTNKFLVACRPWSLREDVLFTVLLSKYDEIKTVDNGLPSLLTTRAQPGFDIDRDTTYRSANGLNRYLDRVVKYGLVLNGHFENQ